LNFNKLKKKAKNTADYGFLNLEILRRNKMPKAVCLTLKCEWSLPTEYHLFYNDMFFDFSNTTYRKRCMIRHLFPKGIQLPTEDSGTNVVFAMRDKQPTPFTQEVCSERRLQNISKLNKLICTLVSFDWETWIDN